MFNRLLRAGEGRQRKNLQAVVEAVNAREPEIAALDDAALAAKTIEFRGRLERGESLESIEAEAFAVVREAARRTLGQRPYDVQVMGAAVLARGKVAEMKTGEGKTLVATMPAYLHAIGGRGVHVVTVNDYLASRDASWMGRVHRFLGLQVGLITPDADAAEKRAAYAADITYGTNNEFGFDYLRDNMAQTRDGMVQRGHSYAIVDEVDSILIDEARTPLIIAAPAGQEAEWFVRFAKIAEKLEAGRDYDVDFRRRQVLTTEEGVARVERLLGVANLYDEANTDLVHHLEVALSAKEIYRRDDQYIVKDGEVLIVDEFTGRVLEGRRYSDGIHQAIEAKEGVPVLDENLTMATITLQNYFRMYDKLAGMTGTAMTEAAEFSKIYGLDVVEIPTNKPVARIDQDDVIYATLADKWAAVVEEVKQRHAAGQPVLLGTASIERSEELSTMLKKAGIPHRVLNAKNHFQEAEIIAQAGRPGAVTVATNMAGRGVDIMLGGNAEAAIEARISANDIDPDSPEAQRIRDQITAEVEENRRRVLAAGGLYVIGTERHESRRIDNQLRGRSGRQGDPGESRFFLSAEDELVRRFAGERMSTLMARLPLQPGEPISAPMLSKAVERAQMAVEAQNFEIRRTLLEYDDIGNQQREVLYALRREALGAENEARIWEWVYQVAQDLAGEFEASGYAEGDATDPEEAAAQAATLRRLAMFGIDEQTVVKATATYGERIVDLFGEAIGDALEKKIAEFGDDWEQIRRGVALAVIDRRWVDHLTGLEYLRSSVGLRGISGVNPIHEYQREAYDLFEALTSQIAEDTIRYILATERVPAEQVRSLQGRPQGGGSSQPVRAGEKVGRNAPCPCGSGLKYKRCHGAAAA